MEHRTLIYIEPQNLIRAIDFEHILTCVRLLSEEELSLITGQSKRTFADNIRISQIGKGSIVVDLLTIIPDYLEFTVSVLGLIVGVLNLVSDYKKRKNHANDGNNTVFNAYGNNVSNNKISNNINFSGPIVVNCNEGKETNYVLKYLISAVKNDNHITFVEEGRALKLWRDSVSNDVYASIVDVPCDNNSELDDPISKALYGQGFEDLKRLFKC